MNEILTPVNLAGKLSKDDREILAEERAALESLVIAILENKRLAYMIVSAWLKKNNYLLLPKDFQGYLHGDEYWKRQ